MKAGAAGGIEAVVKAINTHINNAGVCEQGCGALNNMTFNSSKKHHIFVCFMTNPTRKQRNCQEVEHYHHTSEGQRGALRTLR